MSDINSANDLCRRGRLLNLAGARRTVEQGRRGRNRRQRLWSISPLVVSLSLPFATRFNLILSRSGRLSSALHVRSQPADLQTDGLPPQPQPEQF